MSKKKADQATSKQAKVDTKSNTQRAKPEGLYSTSEQIKLSRTEKL